MAIILLDDVLLKCHGYFKSVCEAGSLCLDSEMSLHAFLWWEDLTFYPLLKVYTTYATVHVTWWHWACYEFNRRTCAIYHVTWWLWASCEYNIRCKHRGELLCHMVWVAQLYRMPFTLVAVLGCKKYLAETIFKRKDLFWFMVLVHGQLTLLFLGLWEDRNLEAVLFTFWWPGSDERTEGEGVFL